MDHNLSRSALRAAIIQALPALAPEMRWADTVVPTLLNADTILHDLI